MQHFYWYVQGVYLHCFFCFFKNFYVSKVPGYSHCFLLFQPKHCFTPPPHTQNAAHSLLQYTPPLPFTPTSGISSLRRSPSEDGTQLDDPVYFVSCVCWCEDGLRDVCVRERVRCVSCLIIGLDYLST